MALNKARAPRPVSMTLKLRNKEGVFDKPRGAVKLSLHWRYNPDLDDKKRARRW